MTRNSDPKLPENPRQAIQEALDEVLRMHNEDAGELLLVRNAEAARSEGNDPMLSCTGLEQAERLAARLGGTWFEAIYCAPERRAQQTARVLAGVCERSVYVLEGLADIELDAERAEVAWEPRLVERFADTPRWDSLPGFECSRRFRRRAVQTIERILAINASRRVVVVTHASVINAYLSMLLSIPADQFFTPEHTSVSVVRWREGRYVVRSLNDLSHLSPAFAMAAGGELFTLR